ncbi:hypothetical protein BSKO_03203 [Bryopsis sp. KO-2023]|nr:hypothetical protein BSKO_03203 [Bryopsis sp. KO-2023]
MQNWRAERKRVLSEMSTTWESLPQDVVQLIVDLLRWPEVGALCLVNRHWKATVRTAVRTLRPSQPNPDLVDILPNIESLDLSSCWDGVDDLKVIRIARKLARQKTLRSLNLSKCHALTNRAIAEVSRSLLDLETLVLTGCREPFPIAQAKSGKMGYAGVNGGTLIGLKKLKHLDLQWNPVSDTSMKTLVELTSLTKLMLGECPGISDTGVAMLRKLAGIQSLSLDRTMVSAWGLKEIVGMGSIKQLSLRTCSGVGDEELVVLAGLSSLESLNVSKCNVTDSGVAALSGLPALTELDLSCCLMLSGECFLDFQNSGVLRNLKLQDCFGCGNDETLRFLSGIPSLREIDLHNCCAVTDSGMPYLARLPLEALDLSLCNEITKAGLAVLCKVHTLTSLDTSFWVGLTDEWMPCLGQLTNLSSLKLSCCGQISDEGLCALKPLGGCLKQLSCSDCRGLTSKSVRFIADTFGGLENLEVAWLGITDEDCKALRKLPKLTRIDMKGCPHLTIKGMRELWYVDGAFDNVKSPQQRMQ